MVNSTYSTKSWHLAPKGGGQRWGKACNKMKTSVSIVLFWGVMKMNTNPQFYKEKRDSTGLVVFGNDKKKTTTRKTRGVNLMNSNPLLKLDIYQLIFHHTLQHNKIIDGKGVLGLILAQTPASLTLGLLPILFRLTTKIEWEKLPLSMI